MVDKVEQGKKNRKSGTDFERRVRKDLEENGWFVTKFMNNIELYGDLQPADNFWHCKSVIKGKFIPAKHKFIGKGRPMAIGTGFPDFLCFKVHDLSSPVTHHIEFVESKSNGQLDSVEKAKCRWLYEEGYPVKIASKTKVKNKIVIKYEDFWEKYADKLE